MNKNQKIVLAIFFPIILFFVAFTIAYYSTTTIVPGLANLERMFETGVASYTHNPFDWGRAWGVWLVYSASCCLFEFLLFRDKKKER